MTLVLADMDGVLVDWGEAFGRALDKYGEAAARIPRHEDQRSFNLYEGLDESETLILNEVMMELNYFDMLPIEGAAEALDSMLASKYHDVMVCTSPWPGNEDCIPGKLAWLEHFIGKGWADRAIITRDKTVVAGDYLIDDKPKITGRVGNPNWTHIVFDQPYNQDVTTQPRLMSWEDWDGVRFK